MVKVHFSMIIFVLLAMAFTAFMVTNTEMRRSFREGKTLGWREGMAAAFCIQGHEWEEQLDDGKILVWKCSAKIGL